MDMTGEQLVPAPRSAVWAALNDPDILRQCIPGCETLDKTSDTTFEASVMIKVGPVKARFKGKVALSDIDPPNGYTISGEAQGGVAAGFGKGGAKVSLAEENGATRLSYAVNAQVGGKLAQIGARLIDATAAKMADDFFAKFGEIVGQSNATSGDAAPASGDAVAPHAAPAAPQIADPGPEPDSGGLPAWMWIAGVIVLVGAATLLVTKM